MCIEYVESEIIVGFSFNSIKIQLCHVPAYLGLLMNISV